MPGLRAAFFRALFRLDALWDAASRRVRRPLGLVGPPRLLPYRGFGSPEGVLVKARVVENRFAPPLEGQKGLLASAVASYKRYATRELPGVAVRATWNGRTWRGVTDEEGFLDLWVEPPEDAGHGWHEVRLEVEGASGEGARADAPVLLAGPEAAFGVISDIDDTVIATGVKNVLTRAWALFLTDHRVRLPFEGVAAFYGALRQGRADRAVNPLVYISSSPWNLYEHLDAFMKANGIPFGPILLRDWGLSRAGFAPGGGHGHKLTKIREVLAAWPRLPFVLIGDSGQEDAEHYARIVREHPGRIRAVYIRKVAQRRGRDAQLERLGAEIAAAGSALVTVATTEEAARDAAARGLVRPAEVGVVHEEREAELEADAVHAPVPDEG